MMRTILTIFLCLPVAAQIPRGTPEPRATVHVFNPLGQERADVATCVVPFARGVYRGEPLCVADVQGQPDTGCQVTPFGARWADGSWRTARVSFPTDAIEPWATQEFQLLSGAGKRPAFALSRAIRSRGSKLRLGIRMAGRVKTFRHWKTLEDGHLVKAWRSRVRLNSPMWAEITIEARSGLDSLRFWLHYGDSDMTVPTLKHEVGALSLIVRGAVPAVWHQSGYVRISTNAGAHAIRLCEPATWSDGESKALAGSLTFGVQNITNDIPMLAVAEWQSSGAFGPWGIVPGLRAGWDHNKSRARAMESANSRMERWGAPYYGCAKYPGQAGSQNDFRTTVLGEAANGFPAMLWPVGRSVYQEACRPTWVRDFDGSAYRFSQHLLPRAPKIQMWSGTVFRTSQVKLGKPTAAGLIGAHGFGGHDRQHWSINYLTYWTLLTGDRWGMDACQHHTEIWMGCQQVNTGNPVIDGMGAARGVGRTLQAGVLLYLMTGRQDLARVIRQRCDLVKARYVGRNPTYAVRPLQASPPDPRQLGGRYHWWSPWQEAVGVRGLDAVVQVLGYKPAADVRDVVARSLALHGVWKGTEGGLLCGFSVAWLGNQVGERFVPSGRPLPPNPVGMRSGGMTFNVWAWPAIQIAEEVEPRAIAFLEQMEGQPFSWEASEWGVAR